MAHRELSQRWGRYMMGSPGDKSSILEIAVIARHRRHRAGSGDQRSAPLIPTRLTKRQEWNGEISQPGGGAPMSAMTAMSRDDGDLLLLHQERKTLKLVFRFSVARDRLDLAITHLLH